MPKELVMYVDKLNLILSHFDHNDEQAELSYSITVAIYKHAKSKMVLFYFYAVLSAASRCIRSMKQLKPELGKRHKAKEEVSSLFGKRKKDATKCVWKHKFICLANCNQERIPTTDLEKDKLLMAGLGEKEIEFSNLTLSATDFRDLLYQHFPTLQEGGGFQFFKCKPNSRSLEQLSSTTLSSPSMLKSRVGNARTYIRPMQQNLDLTPIIELPGGV